MYETPKEKEDRLYRESRSLKFQARQLRKKRVEKEKAEEERRVAYQAEAEALKKERAQALKANEARVDRDNRIRKALLSMNDSFKAGGLKIEGSDNWGAKKPCFRLYDTKTLQWVQINVMHNGYQWD